ncbi:hypothetical protein G7054_g7040 [Neopestalotiopsis clavispora]|nr:hypothetical protein G7054_g7040 [Neopestalotiopsis clavispora]
MHFSTFLVAALPVAALAMPAADPQVLTFPGSGKNQPGPPGNGGGGHNSPHPTTTSTTTKGGHGPSPTPTKTSSTSTTTSTSTTISTTSTTSTSSSSTSTSTSTSTTTSTTLTSSTTSISSTSTTSTSSASTPTSTAPAGVTIKGISYAGSGCNAGSVAGAISSDAQTITVLYDSFIAQAGPGITPAEARKNCQLNVQVELPQGWQFSVFKADYRGYAFLQDGDKGVIKATYYFSGDSTQISSELDLAGAYDDNYLKTDEFGIESTVWSPCGEEGLLNVNSEVRVTPLTTTNTALLTVDSTDLSFETVHYLQWQTC